MGEGVKTENKGLAGGGVINMLRTEFHCHTCYSSDSLTGLEELLQTAQAKGIDRLVITDHNTIAGARKAQAIDPQRVIVGEEIKTTQGELLAAFVQEEIPRGLTPLETIELLRQQGAFISVSHPFDVMRSGHWELAALEEIAPRVDAIEVFNARCLWPGFNRKAAAFAQAHGLPGTVGSDAHVAFELGSATLLLPDFHDAAGLKQAMAQAVPKTAYSGPWVRFFSRFAVIKKKL